MSSSLFSLYIGLNLQGRARRTENVTIWEATMSKALFYEADKADNPHQTGAKRRKKSEKKEKWTGVPYYTMYIRWRERPKTLERLKWVNFSAGTFLQIQSDIINCILDSKKYGGLYL